MAISTEEAVREMFLEATRQNLARSLRTGEDWDRFKEITQTASARLESEQAAHAYDYQARIAEAKEIIMREEHGIRLDQPLPPGVVKQSNDERLQTIAETRVRQDYDRRIAVIKADELNEYRHLTNDIRIRDRSDHPSLTRTQTTDRTRSGPSQT